MVDHGNLMNKITEARIKDMKRIILITENREPLSSKVSRRFQTITDKAKERIRLTFTGVGMVLGALRR